MLIIRGRRAINVKCEQKHRNNSFFIIIIITIVIQVYAIIPNDLNLSGANAKVARLPIASMVPEMSWSVSVG